MRITIDRARFLAERAMLLLGYDAEELEIIADHLVDAELKGVDYGGLARALTLVERMSKPDYVRQPIRVAHETPVSTLLAGGNNVGYLVARRAVDNAIEKATKQGVAVVGANDTWATGLISYYAERAAKADLVSMIASNASPWVAPHGGAEGRFGTNPICFGFPTPGDPVIWDIGTSNLMLGALHLMSRLGEKLPEGVAFDRNGNPTLDPDEAIKGAMTVWGGHRGSGLAICVALLGAMADAPAAPLGNVQYGCLFVLMRPDLLMPTETYKQRVADYADFVRSTRPVPGGARVRMPFDRSAADRRRRIAEGGFEVADLVAERLETIAATNKPLRG